MYCCVYTDYISFNRLILRTFLFVLLLFLKSLSCFSYPSQVHEALISGRDPSEGLLAIFPGGATLLGDASVIIQSWPNHFDLCKFRFVLNIGSLQRSIFVCSSPFLSTFTCCIENPFFISCCRFVLLSFCAHYQCFSFLTTGCLVGRPSRAACEP
jgi:hypothetical protein